MNLLYSISSYQVLQENLLSVSKFSVDNETSKEFENVEEDAEIDGGLTFHFNSPPQFHKPRIPKKYCTRMFFALLRF